jgi:hypothetical protein
MEMKLPSFVVSMLYALGLVLLFVGERLLVGGVHTAVGVVGVALVAATLAFRFVRRAGAKDERRTVEGDLFVLMALGAAGVVAYLLASDLLGLRAQPLLVGWPKLSTVLQVLCPAALVLGLTPLLLVELAYASMARAPHVELGRVRDALGSGVGLGAVLVFAFAAFYVADERDAKADFSYFRTARPGEATRNVVRAFTEPVSVSAFFPPHSDVGDAAVEYLNDLVKESPKLTLTLLDQAVDLAKARELGVSGNGVIVFQKGTKREQVLLPLEYEKAKGSLRSLDQDVQKKLLLVARAKRTLYFTAGHGERTELHAGQFDQRATDKGLRELLKSQNEEVKELGAAEGLATEVPKDAAAVLVMGPTADFLPEEISALNRYAESGGRVLFALDPEAGKDYAGLLAPWGVTFSPTVLCNDQAYVRMHHEYSDCQNLATKSYSSHPSVTTLSQNSARLFTVFMGAGEVESMPKRPPGVAVDLSVKSMPGTWNDANGNFQFDPGKEAKKVYPLIAAVTKAGSPEGRAVVMGDSDVVSDLFFENAGNMYVALDAVKWLLGDDNAKGMTDTEKDEPVEHTRGQDVAWFYGTVFGVPAMVLAAGFGVTRRKRRRA